MYSQNLENAKRPRACILVLYMIARALNENDTKNLVSIL